MAAAPRIERLFTALDIGSWKVAALIAGQSEDGKIHVLGTGQRQSQGVKRGYVADMDKTEQAVREARALFQVGVAGRWPACFCRWTHPPADKPQASRFERLAWVRMWGAPPPSRTALRDLHKNLVGFDHAQVLPGQLLDHAQALL